MLPGSRSDWPRDVSRAFMMLLVLILHIDRRRGLMSSYHGQLGCFYIVDELVDVIVRGQNTQYVLEVD